MIHIVVVDRDVTRTLFGSKTIAGLAVMNNELYVGRYEQPVIEVYDSSTLIFHGNIPVPDLNCVWDLTSCTQCDVVYISDWCNNKINVINERELRHSWSVDYWPVGLSVNSQLNVVVTFNDIQQLRVYSPRGELIRNINLQSDIIVPWNAIQIDVDRYAVVHGDYRLLTALHQVCIINNNGTIIESYGREKGNGTGQLHAPVRMLIFYGRMFVVDYWNHRLLLFDVSPLRYKQELISTRSENLKPWRLAISEDGSRLFVSYSYNPQLRSFNLTWI